VLLDDVESRLLTPDRAASSMTSGTA
jgi:hypothetical protein